MTVTVAPLTTVVMSCVGQDRAGTASGINNAVSRVAGVLAIAILGLVITCAFQARLDHSLTKLAVPANIVHEIEANSTRLAAIRIPAGLDANMEASLRGAISDAFVFAFRLVMGMCVMLAIASAGFAARMISGRSTAKQAQVAE